MALKITVSLFELWKQAELKTGNDISLEEVATATKTTRPFVTKLKTGGEIEQINIGKLVKVMAYLAQKAEVEYQDGEVVPVFKFKVIK